MGGLLPAAMLAAPVVAHEKPCLELMKDAKHGIQTTQENITRMKLKKAPQRILGCPP